MNLENYEDALKSFDASMLIFPNEQTVCQYAKIAIMQEKYEIAIDKYKNVAEY